MQIQLVQIETQSLTSYWVWIVKNNQITNNNSIVIGHCEIKLNNLKNIINIFWWDSLNSIMSIIQSHFLIFQRDNHFDN